MAVPEWFLKATAVGADEAHLQVEGARIRTRTWCSPRSDNGPAVLLVHGGAANSHWWDHVAPLLTCAGQVTAIDLSGHGQSQHRRDYSVALWAAEVAAVLAALPSRPFLIGHSLGGVISSHVAAAAHGSLAGACLIDTPPLPPTRDRGTSVWARAAGLTVRHVDTEKEMVERFRPLPPSQRMPAYVAAHVGRHSLVHTERGFRWQFDPAIFMADGVQLAPLGELDCRLGLIAGSEGMVGADAIQAARAAARLPLASARIAASGHHIMLDQPRELAAAIDEMVTGWRVEDRHLGTSTSN